MNDEYKPYGLMQDEIYLYRKFCEKHKSCNIRTRSAIMEEDCSPIYTTIILHISTIGTSPFAQCEVCGKKESIICQKRVDML